MILHSQPNQFGADKNRNWYIDNIKFVFSHYNSHRSLVDSVESRKANTQNTSENPVDYMLRMVTYYLGRQENSTYNYATTTSDGCNEIPTVWVPGQKVTGLVDFMLGTAVKMIDNIEPGVKLTSRAAVNRKTQLMEKLLLKKEAPELFADMSSYGIEFSPLGGEEDKLESEEDIERYMMHDYKERGDIIAQKMCEDLLLRNGAHSKYTKNFLYALVTGICAVENRMENRKEYFDILPPWQVIWDNTVDDDNNSRARFVGKVEYLTPTDILERYGAKLSSEEIEEIKKINISNAVEMLGVSGTSAQPWVKNNGTPLIAVVTGYWVGPKDMRREKTVDKYGNTHIAKIRKADKTGQYITKTVYKGTLIGSRYLVDHGEDTNIVRRHDNPGEVELPIKVFVPNMIAGTNRSVVSRLHTLQDRIDYLTNKISQMVDKAKGKNFVFNEDKAGGKMPSEILNDFELWGITVVNSNTGEDDDTKYKRLVDVVDMTMDGNIQQLVALRREEERLMEEIVNIPKIALGQQSGYVGAKTQAGTIAQSNLGTAHLYQGYIKFIEYQLRHALNQYKLGAIYEDENDIPVVGTKGSEYLKVTKDFQFEEIGTYLKVRDFIDDQSRERLLSIALAFAQNQVITYEDYLNIEQCTTFTELRAELRQSLRRLSKEREKQQQMQMMMAQMEQQANLEGKVAPEQVRQEGANYRKGMEVAAQTQAQNQEQPSEDLVM